MNMKQAIAMGTFRAVNKSGEMATIEVNGDQATVKFDNGEEKTYKLSTVQRGQGWKPVAENTTTPEAPETTEETAPEATEEAAETLSSDKAEDTNTEEEKEMEIQEQGFAKYGEEVVYVESIHGKMVTIVDQDGVDQPAHIDKLEYIEISEDEQEAWKKILNPAAPSEDKPEAPKAPRTNNGGGRKEDTIWKLRVTGFLASLLEEVKKADPDFTKVKKVGDRNYIVFGAGKTGLSVVVTINKKAVITELYAEGEAIEFAKGLQLEGTKTKEGAKNFRHFIEADHDGEVESIMDLVQGTVDSIFKLAKAVR